jgi:DNA (cytosine-5)-methyltransferase 1
MPVHEPPEDLIDFLDDSTLLSARATAGFLKRARAGNLRFADGFLDDLDAHLERMGGYTQRVSV